jgi:membrane protease YdiL (CAAX protease family)
VLFGAVHGTLSALIPLALLGVVLVLAYEWSRGIALPIAIHALFNLGTTASLWTDTLPAPP